MKELADGTLVTSRGYYFLLDWNDNNEKKLMYGLYGLSRLCDSNINQYIYLMEKAMESELKSLKEKK